MSFSSTTASGTSAALGSVTTPVNPPEVVVWADESSTKQTTRNSARKSKMTSLRFIEANPRFHSIASARSAYAYLAGNATPFSPPWNVYLNFKNGEEFVNRKRGKGEPL